MSFQSSDSPSEAMMLARRTGPVPASTTNQARDARSRAGSTELMKKLKAMDVALEQMSECRETERQNVIRLFSSDTKENVAPDSPSVLNRQSLGESTDEQAPQETERTTARVDNAQRAFFEEEISNFRKKMESVRVELSSRVDNLEKHQSEGERRLHGQHEAHRTETVGQIETLCRGVESQRQHIAQLLDVAKDLTSRLEGVEESLKKSNDQNDKLDTRIVEIGKNCQSIASASKAETRECGEIMQKMTKQMASFRQRVQKVEQEVQDRMKSARTEVERHLTSVMEGLEERVNNHSQEFMEKQIVRLQEDTIREHQALRQQIQQVESSTDQSYIKGALRDVQSAIRRFPERADEVQKRWEDECTKLQDTIDQKCVALHNEALQLAANTHEEFTRRCDYEAGERGLWIERVEVLQKSVREQFAAIGDRLEATMERTVIENDGQYVEMKREMESISEKQSKLNEDMDSLRSRTQATSDSLRSSELVNRVSALELRCDARSFDAGEDPSLGDLHKRFDALVECGDVERAEAHSTRDECRMALKRLESSMADRAMAERRLARRIEDIDERVSTEKEPLFDDAAEAALEERISTLEVRIENKLGDLTTLRTQLDGFASAISSTDVTRNEIEALEARLSSNDEKVKQTMSLHEEQVKEHEEKARQALSGILRLEIAENFRFTQEIFQQKCLELSDNVKRSLDELRAETLPRLPSSQNGGDDFVDRTNLRHRIDTLERRVSELSSEIRTGDDAISVQIRSVERCLKETLASQAEDNAAAFRSVVALVREGQNSDSVSPVVPREAPANRVNSSAVNSSAADTITNTASLEPREQPSSTSRAPSLETRMPSVVNSNLPPWLEPTLPPTLEPNVPSSLEPRGQSPSLSLESRVNSALEPFLPSWLDTRMSPKREPGANSSLKPNMPSSAEPRPASSLESRAPSWLEPGYRSNSLPPFPAETSGRPVPGAPRTTSSPSGVVPEVSNGGCKVPGVRPSSPGYRLREHDTFQK